MFVGDAAQHRTQAHRAASPGASSEDSGPPSQGDETMRFEGFSFGSIRIDGVSYDPDVVTDRLQGPKAKCLDAVELRRF